jgi:hypothetical protein
MLPAPTSAPMNYQMQVKLPPGLVCNKQCIFQVKMFLFFFTNKKCNELTKFPLKVIKRSSNLF